MSCGPEEDARRSNRWHEALVGKQTNVVNRMKSTLGFADRIRFRHPGSCAWTRSSRRLSSGVDAGLDAAMGFLDGDFGDELGGRGGAEVVHDIDFRAAVESFCAHSYSDK